MTHCPGQRIDASQFERSHFDIACQLTPWRVAQRFLRKPRSVPSIHRSLAHLRVQRNGRPSRCSHGEPHTKSTEGAISLNNTPPVQDLIVAACGEQDLNRRAPQGARPISRSDYWLGKRGSEEWPRSSNLRRSNSIGVMTPACRSLSQ